MTVRIGVAVMAALLLLYIVLVAQRAWLFLISGDPVGIAMGGALALLPLLALWALARELWFGHRAAQLGSRLQHEGGLPDVQVAIRPSGRVIRTEADAVFEQYRQAVRVDQHDWRAWYRLGIAYDAAGDRRRGRSAIRQAIRLSGRGEH